MGTCQPQNETGCSVLGMQDNATSHMHAQLMNPEQDLVSISQAATEKECSRTTLYRAVGDGRLDSAEVGGRTMLVRNATYRRFTPKNVGARAQKRDSDA